MNEAVYTDVQAVGFHGRIILKATGVYGPGQELWVCNHIHKDVTEAHECATKELERRWKDITNG